MIAATQSNHPLAAVSALQPGAAVPLDEARSRIRNAQMRITKPRLAIIESLHNRKGPLSIERIHQDVGSEVCDLVTVYRCLAAFEKLDIVRRSYLHNGTCLYELTIGKERQYHIVCKGCGATEHVDYFPVDSMDRRLQERGYSQVSHVIEFFGICPTCQQAAPARNASVTIPARNASVTIPGESV